MRKYLQSPSGLVLVNLALALAYWLTGHLALLAVRGTGLASPVWPAAGVAFALVYQYGPKLLPGIVLGSMVDNLLALDRAGMAVRPALVLALGIGCGAAAQALLGRILAHRVVGWHPSFVTPGQIIRFLLLAGPVACTVNASTGVLLQTLFHVPQEKPVSLVWLTWWVGDTIGVVIFGIITLMLLPEQREVWEGRRLKVSVPAVVAVVVSLFLFLQGAAMAESQRVAQAANGADRAVHAIKEEVTRLAAVLEGVRGLYLASEHVTALEFRTYANAVLQEEDALQAISWNPVLTDAAIPAFEQWQRNSEELAGYTVTEKNSDGTVVPVRHRVRHVVVGYIEPLAANTKALGYDIASDARRRAAILVAESTGGVASTAPLDLVQEQGTQKGILTLLPIYDTALTPPTVAARRAHVVGFAVGVYRMQDLLNAAFLDAEWNDASVTLYDASDGTLQQMARHSSSSGGAAQPVQRRSIRVLGRTWRLDYSPTYAAVHTSDLVSSPAVLVLGLIIAALLMAFLLLITGLERVARREADVDPLTGVANRRALLVELETARRRAQSQGTAHVLLFMDLDRFKPVNDTLGHAAGDELLRSFAALLRSAVRERDTVARMGGDEFAVVLFDCTMERAESIADEIVQRTRALAIGSAVTPLHIGVSVGLAAVQPPDPDDVSHLLARADRASYTAKFAGGNRVHAAVEAHPQMRG